MSEVTERLGRQDASLIRLDVTSSLFSKLNAQETTKLIQALPLNETVESVHLSGDLESDLTPPQIEQLVLSIGAMKKIKDLSVFQGRFKILNEKLLSRCLERAKGLKALLLFQFSSLHKHPVLARTLRHHPNLERITLNLPNSGLPWGCLDDYAKAFGQMTNLRVLQIRCCQKRQQEEAVISPDAIGLLFTSKTIRSLYLENCGLLDDHMDIMAQEIPTKNHVLSVLNLKDNKLSEDALYTLANMFPCINDSKLTSIDLSGVAITKEAGKVLAAGMAQNTRITHLELEGGEERYQDEFDIPVGHSQEDWAKKIYYHIRLNRALHGKAAPDSKATFVEAINSVSDQIDCIYHFVRTYPGHCKGPDQTVFAC